MDDVATVWGFWSSGGMARGGSGVKGRTAAAGVLSCLWGRGRVWQWLARARVLPAPFSGL